jgi:ABC-type Zn uptake system ZnuABC Zn-binding protein ZnuA
MRRLRRRIVGGLLVVAAAQAVFFIGCSKADDPWKGLGGPPRVLVSFPPLYSFAKKVAGDDAAVLSLMISQGPHEHEAGPEDVLKFEKADLFFMNGLQLEKRGFVDHLKSSSHNRDIQVIELGKSIPPKRLLAIAEEEEGDDHDEHEHDHEHGHYDPHVWLGIPEAVFMVQKIRDELIRKDPVHKSGYTRRAADYIEELKKLQKDGLAALHAKKNRKLITMHESLRYFARTFRLKVVDSIQPRPGVEADANKLGKLVAECRKQNVRVIAVEPQYQESGAEALKGELKKKGLKDVAIVTIDPLETATEELDADFYVRKMRQNLNNLRKALK